MLARKFRLVLGTGPGVGRWNKIGCLPLVQHAGGEEVAGLAVPALRSFRKQPR